MSRKKAVTKKKATVKRARRQAVIETTDTTGPVVLEIEKDIPIPDTTPMRSTKNPRFVYQWAKMKIGDSFLVPNKTARAFAPMLTKARRDHAPKMFIAADVTGGVRVWRVRPTKKKR